MQIATHPSIIRAQRIVSLVRKSKAKGLDLELRNWANGREQGFCLTATTGPVENWKCAVFAESRGSEQIVVVAGDRNHFDHQTNQPDDKLWEKKGEGLLIKEGRWYFDTEEAAARFLVGFFRK